ncbi:hypothetical protein [Cytobacillus firmus]|uniref:Uncharacterized protein n=1 Tax=Cytobacillus firmus DS1 TaxID=1307436 RepID=W7LC24_CYTFI|nr:hypothetical protein [Cytobacillus firmus]EWG12707.1 hypothetical protein PBF_04190 [Cytobacillus firmus DS1]
MKVPTLYINEILTDWAKMTPPIMDFTVENVLYAANLGDEYYDIVFNYLVAVDGFIVRAKKILLCENNHKCQEFLLDEPIDEEEIYECDCSEEELDHSNILIVFDFTQSFIQESKDSSVKKKANYQNRHLQLA